MAGSDEDYASLDEHLDPEVQELAAGSPETPDADAAEQRVPVNPAERYVRPTTAFEVDEYDALEQAHVVDLDDDYR